jgi:hypothetical protein
MICEHIDTCALIHKMSKPVPFTVNVMKIKYCESRKNRCARYILLQVFKMDDIPNDLWPSDEIGELELVELKLAERQKKPEDSTEEGMP